MDNASLPLADGGDGSVAAALAAGSNRTRDVQGPPAGPPQPSSFNGSTAIIEIANTCGLTTHTAIPHR